MASSKTFPLDGDKLDALTAKNRVIPTPVITAYTVTICLFSFIPSENSSSISSPKPSRPIRRENHLRFLVRFFYLDMLPVFPYMGKKFSLQPTIMEIYPLGLVLASAFIHVLWNTLMKSSQDRLVFMGWVFLFSALFYFPPFLMNLGKFPIPLKGWALIWVSGFIHAVYIIVLGNAYKEGDLSLVYPLARSAPLFVTIWAVVFLGERLTVGGIMGILLVVIGAYIIGFRTLQWKESIRPLLSLRDKPYQLALLTALIVSLYSIADKIGVRYVHPFIFLYLMLLPRFVFYIPYVIKIRHTGIMPEWRRNKRNILLMGFLQFLTSFLILYAMTLTKVSYIVAIRQISVVFAVLMGTALLKEKYGLVRLVASAFIFLGVFLIGMKG